MADSKAKCLGEGWVWRAYEDGDGCLKSPEGHTFFWYDGYGNEYESIGGGYVSMDDSRYDPSYDGTFSIDGFRRKRELELIWLKITAIRANLAGEDVFFDNGRAVAIDEFLEKTASVPRESLEGMDRAYLYKRHEGDESRALSAIADGIEEIRSGRYLFAYDEAFNGVVNDSFGDTIGIWLSEDDDVLESVWDEDGRMYLEIWDGLTQSKTLVELRVLDGEGFLEVTETHNDPTDDARVVTLLREEHSSPLHFAEKVRGHCGTSKGEVKEQEPPSKTEKAKPAKPAKPTKPR